MKTESFVVIRKLQKWTLVCLLLSLSSIFSFQSTTEQQAGDYEISQPVLNTSTLLWKGKINEGINK